MLSIPAERDPVPALGELEVTRWSQGCNQMGSLGVARQGRGAHWEASGPEPSVKASRTRGQWSHVFTDELDIGGWTGREVRVHVKRGNNQET